MCVGRPPPLCGLRGGPSRLLGFLPALYCLLSRWSCPCFSRWPRPPGVQNHSTQHHLLPPPGPSRRACGAQYSGPGLREEGSLNSGAWLALVPTRQAGQKEGCIAQNPGWSWVQAVPQSLWPAGGGARPGQGQGQSPQTQSHIPSPR